MNKLVLNKISESLANNLGVPLGSVLGLVLFTLYINDVTHPGTICYKLNLFADDTLITVSDDSEELLVLKLN